MQKQISTGVTLISGVALQPVVAGMVSDVAAWCHVTIQADYWAAGILALVGLWIHNKPDAAAPASAVNAVPNPPNT